MKIGNSKIKNTFIQNENSELEWNNFFLVQNNIQKNTFLAIFIIRALKKHEAKQR